MNMAETLVPSRTAPPQSASRDTRVKDDGSPAAARGEDDSFGDVMSDLADRAEAKRNGASDPQGRVERSGTASQSKSDAAQDGAGDAADQLPAAEPADAAGEGASPSEADLLLAQMALVLGPIADGAVAQGEVPAELEIAANATSDEPSALKSSWQLLTSLANGSEGKVQAGMADGDAAPAALAALSDGVEEAEFANLLPTVAQSSDEGADEASFPAMKVTVTGEETHFAPVQSAEATLNRLLSGQAAGASGASQTSTDSAAGPPGEKASAKSNGVGTVVAAEVPRPEAAAGSAMNSGGGMEGSGGERRLSDGQTPAPSADQQGARSAAIAAAAFEAATANSSAGPSSDASPSTQIARRIAAELTNPTSRPVSSTTSSDGAVKVLHLQLEPANLGSVTVRIALKDNVINLHVEASRHETAFAIEKDRELLSNALKSAGYMVDGISSQPASDPARPSLQAQAVTNDGQMSSSLQSQSDSQSGLAQSGRRNQGDEGRQFTESGFASGSQVNESRGEGSRVSNGALYV